MLLWHAKRSVHVSWLVAVLCLGICIGSFLPTVFSLLIVSLEWLVVAAIFLLAGISKRKLYVVPLVLMAGGLIGLWRSSAYQLQLTPYEALIDRTVELRGRVMEDSDVGKRGEVVLRLGEVAIEGRPLEGSVWTSASIAVDVKRGDNVTVKGKLGEGFGSFAASMYRVGVLGVERPEPGDPALAARDWFAAGVRYAIPEPEASLGVGYVVGQRRSLPEDLDKALRAAGLTHVVVASGYNLTILVGAARRVFAKTSKFLAAFVSGGLVVSFMAVTGMSPSMSRAGLVTGLGLLAWYYGRQFHPFVLLPLAAAATLLTNPSYAQNDLGWQLSFAAFAGVLIVAPLVQAYFYGDKAAGVVRQVFVETVCAWTCTLPLIVMAFGQLSNVAVLANMLVLPLVPLAMLLTFVAGVGALVVPPLATLIGFPAVLVLGYMTKVTLYLGSVPWAQTEITMGPAGLIGCYVILVTFCAYMWQRTQYDFLNVHRVAAFAKA